MSYSPRNSLAAQSWTWPPSNSHAFNFAFVDTEFVTHVREVFDVAKLNAVTLITFDVERNDVSFYDAHVITFIAVMHGQSSLRIHDIVVVMKKSRKNFCAVDKGCSEIRPCLNTGNVHSSYKHTYPLTIYILILEHWNIYTLSPVFMGVSTVPKLFQKFQYQQLRNAFFDPFSLC